MELSEICLGIAIVGAIVSTAGVAMSVYYSGKLDVLEERSLERMKNPEEWKAKLFQQYRKWDEEH
ncbi:hypothetical protein HY450_02415 [Candidatus Pacearchaeota archaeon]|nr:hypothetical protein [Candidatus Pacearchaeota archaeon]